jgi:hypothetical protein
MSQTFAGLHQRLTTYTKLEPSFTDDGADYRTTPVQTKGYDKKGCS